MKTFKCEKIKRYENDILERWTLINGDFELDCLNYGATWYDWRYLYESLLYRLPKITDYVGNPYHVGHTIGRVAGRLADGKFTLDGVQYVLPANNGPNVLHSTSIKGFDDYFWQAEVLEDDDKIGLRFFQQIMNDGFPGRLAAEVIYTLTEQGEVEIKYQGQSDMDTLFNPTTHVYFNLEQNQAFNEIQLQIDSKQRLEVDENKLPTGILAENKGCYDFTQSRNLREMLIKHPLGEIDDSFVMQNDGLVRLSCQNKQIVIKSDRNCAVVFTANPEENLTKGQKNALAIEMQTLPDAINHQNFGDIILSAGEVKSYTTLFKFNKLT